MEDMVLDFMKQRPVVIPRVLFTNYKKLNITLEELVILIYFIDTGDKFLYNPDVIVNDLGLDKYLVMQLVSNLVDKKLISVVVQKNDKLKTEEYICLDLLYNRLFNSIIDKEDVSSSSDIFEKFQDEFGRPISPMEYEIIKGWIDDKFSEELITEALKEAVYNNVNNLRYIDKILYDWKKKGFKCKEDVVRDKANFKKKSGKVSYFDYNWLDE